MTSLSTRCSDWRALPFREIWAVDTEYYPGPGLAHGGERGDLITPLCLVALELRSGHRIRLWQGEFGPFPPYRLDAEALFLSYMATAEFGFHRALGWGQPARAIDIYVEFRHLTNDVRVKSSGPTRREKGFYSLIGALRYFGLEELDATGKTDMRDRILAGPPFSLGERADIEHYAEGDVLGLARLAKRLLPRILSLPHALHRAQFAWALSGQERRGPPVNRADRLRLKERWTAIKTDLVLSIDRDYGCYEIDADGAHFRDDRLLAYAAHQGIDWPRLENDPTRPDKRAETLRMMASAYPQLGKLHELRSVLAQLKNNKLAIGHDDRNRCLLGLFGTKTGRNAPSNSEFIFGPAKCLRFLIEPPPGLALIHRDYSQQEVRIAAYKSGDGALLAACDSDDGDVYLGIAKQLGFDPAKPGVRDLFKIVVLAINYGAGPHMLAALAGISLYEAGEIVARLKARFRRFCEWCDNVADFAGLKMALVNELGWSVRCPPGSPPRTIRNWPVQACGSAIMQVCSILAERRGIEIIAPVHDAFLAQAALIEAKDVSQALDRCMRDAAAVVLQGYELPTSDDKGMGLILPAHADHRPVPEIFHDAPHIFRGRYYDKRGAVMWREIHHLLEATEKGARRAHDN